MPQKIFLLINGYKRLSYFKSSFFSSSNQSQDFQGILTSRMVGRFGRKIGRLTHIQRFEEEIYKKVNKKKRKITYIPHVCLYHSSLSHQGIFLLQINNCSPFVSNKSQERCLLPSKSHQKQEDQSFTIAEVIRLDRFLDSTSNPYLGETN